MRAFAGADRVGNAAARGRRPKGIEQTRRGSGSRPDSCAHAYGKAITLKF
jgi:hypothetical protein